jgi:hypothetical protein
MIIVHLFPGNLKGNVLSTAYFKDAARTIKAIFL